MVDVAKLFSLKFREGSHWVEICWWSILQNSNRRLTGEEISGFTENEIMELKMFGAYLVIRKILVYNNMQNNTIL